MRVKNLNPEFVKEVREKKFKGRVIENEIFTRKLNFGQEIRTLTISDMHGYTNRSGRTEKLINEVREQEPDVIFIPGDIFSGGKPWEGGEKLEKFKEFIKEISEIAPVVLTWGNHDLRGMNEENEELRINTFQGLSELNPGRVFPLFNDKVTIGDMEVIGIVPEFNLMENEGMADQLNGIARDKEVETFNKEYGDLIEEKPDTLIVALLHDPHLLEVSAQGTSLGKLSVVDSFIAGHLHDGYLALFNCFNELKKKLTGTGFKVFDYDGGLVEQVYGLNDKTGKRVVNPRILGPTTGCRGNIYVDDNSNRKLLEVYGKWYKNAAPLGEEPKWEKIRRKDAIKEYINNKYHSMHINEGLYPNFFLPIHIGKMDTISVVTYKGAPEDLDEIKSRRR